MFFTLIIDTAFVFGSLIRVCESRFSVILTNFLFEVLREVELFEAQRVNKQSHLFGQIVQRHVLMVVNRNFYRRDLVLWLLVWQPNVVEVRVRDSLHCCDAFFGVELKHLVEKLDSLVVAAGKHV